MTHYIDKDALVAEIDKRRNKHFNSGGSPSSEYCYEDDEILNIIDTLEVINPYEQCIQYDSVKAAIQAHAETYSFNIESKLFNQLTKEQQKIWRKEIEQAVISGGDEGYSLAKDTRYKENHEVKEVDISKEIESEYNPIDGLSFEEFARIAKHFYSLGLAQKGEEV